MKVYTEVNYTWDDEKNELVKESEKSFDYEGEVDQCIKIGGYSFKPKPPVWKPPEIPKIDLDPRTSDINIPSITPPDIPIPNVPMPNTGQVTDAMNLGMNNLGYLADETLGAGGSLINRNLHELAKLGKEAWSGQGGYADDAGPDDPPPPPTGSEDATAGRTLLTGQRKVAAGRKQTYGAGSASKL